MAKRRRTRQSKTQDAVIRSAEMIGWALGGLEREIVATRERLVALTGQAAKLRATLGARVTTAAEAVKPGKRRKRRTMSAEARKRMSEMMKKRWAERKRNKK